MSGYGEDSELGASVGESGKDRKRGENASERLSGGRSSRLLHEGHVVSREASSTDAWVMRLHKPLSFIF